MSPNEQVSVWLGAFPVIEQRASAGLIDQLMPVPPGSGSLRVTFFATPGPLFATVIVNPIAVPALTDDASAVLLMVRFGHWTVVDALA
jgi:hypothetical protein